MTTYVQYLKTILQNISNCNSEKGLIEAPELTEGLLLFNISMYDSYSGAIGA